MAETLVRSQANRCVVDRVRLDGVSSEYWRFLFSESFHQCSTFVPNSCAIGTTWLSLYIDSFIIENTSLSALCVCVSLALCLSVTYTHTHPNTVTTFSLAILYVKFLIAVDEVGSFQDS